MIDEDFYKQKTISGFSPKETTAAPFPVKIGPYKIEGLLNKGGMSLLYLGIHPETAQPIVIKVLIPKFLKSQETSQRFLKEAHIIGLTNHPNIVKLYGEGQWEKGLYIAMEFIRGISLRQFIQQRALSLQKAIEIILQVAYALCHLHTHGVIHRDLKPENILITESGDVKVIDFGIAQLQEEKSYVRPEGFMGTPVYMSPEQKEHPPKVFYSSDIYALGIIAYELILGRLSHGIIHLSLLPKPLQPFIEKTLKTKPQERYQDIVDFITDISHYAKQSRDETSPRHEELSDTLLNMMQQVALLLIPPKPPTWAAAEIGLASPKGLLLRGLYLDFFRLPDNRFAILIAEPMEDASLFHTTILRGMIRMAMETHFLNGKNNAHPIQMVQLLNRSLCTDPMRCAFHFSFLLLTPDKNLLSFVSCNNGHLIHVPEGSHALRQLTTPNPSLGVDPNTSFLETADNWSPGDLLILHTSRTKGVSQEWIQESLFLSPQPQADKLFVELISDQECSHRQPVVITLLRI